MDVVHTSLYSRNGMHDIHTCQFQAHHWVVTRQQLVGVVHVRHNKKEHVVEGEAVVLRQYLLR